MCVDAVAHDNVAQVRYAGIEATRPWGMKKKKKEKKEIQRYTKKTQSIHVVYP